MRERPRARTVVLTAGTVAAALPFVVLGLQSVAGQEVPLLVVAGLAVTAGVLALWPIKLRPDLELSPAEVAIFAALLFTPAGCASLVAAGARVGARIASPRSPIRAVRDVAAAVAAAGFASLLYVEMVDTLGRTLGPRASIAASVLAAALYLALLIVQIAAWRVVHGRSDLPALGPLASPTGRTHVLWLVGSVVAFEIVRIEPLFLVPILPLIALSYAEIRSRFAAERRGQLLQTAVDVSHAVGSTLDTLQVFRAVYAHVRSVLAADAFFVALANDDRTQLSYRFLVDESRELEPTARALEGTLPMRRLWRLAVRLNGRRAGPLTLNDVLIAHDDPATMSRYRLKIGARQGPQKSSGLWGVTAAGLRSARSATGSNRLS